MGFKNWLTHLAEKTGGSQEALSALFGRVEALTGVLALTGNQANSFTSIMEQMSVAAGSTETAFRKVEETSEAAFARLKASVSVFMATIGNQLMPVVSGIASAIGLFASKFSAFGEAHPLLTRIVVTLGAVSAAILVIGGFSMIMAGQVLMAMAMINISTGGILLAIGAVATAITGLVVAFSDGTDEMGVASGWLASCWSFVKESFYTMAKPVAYGVGYLAGILTSAWQEVADYTIGIWPLIKKNVLNTWSAITTVLTPQIAVATGLITFAWKAIAVTVKTSWEIIKLATVTTIGIITNTIAIGWHLISGIFKAGLQFLVGDWSGAWETMKSTFGKIWANIKSIFNNYIGWVTGRSKIFQQAGQGYINALFDGIMAGWKRLKSGVVKVMESIRDLLPGSDAKEGPLSDLTRAGKALMPTFAKGILKTEEEPAAVIARSLGNIDLTPSINPYPSASPADLPNIVLPLPTFCGQAPAAPPTPNQITFQRGAFNITINGNGATSVDDLEERLTDIFRRAVMRMGESYSYV